MAQSLVTDYCVYLVTQCLADNVKAELEEDDFPALRKMKEAINSFIDRHRSREFAFESFIERETDRTVDEAREYVQYVVKVLSDADKIGK